MAQDNSGLTRRTALKGLGGAAATVGVGGAALLATSGPAAAGGFDVQETVEISSDDGSVEYVAIHGDSVIKWDGFDTEATHFGIDITVDIQEVEDDALPKTVHTTGPREITQDWGGAGESSTGPGTSGTLRSDVGLKDDNGDGDRHTHDPATDWHIIGSDPDGYGLPQNSVDASLLNVGAGDDANADTTESFTVVMDSTYTWYSSADSSDDIYSETFTTNIDVDVTNEGREATVSSGEGEDGATGA